MSVHGGIGGSPMDAKCDRREPHLTPIAEPADATMPGTDRRALMPPDVMRRTTFTTRPAPLKFLAVMTGLSADEKGDLIEFLKSL